MHALLIAALLCADPSPSAPPMVPAPEPAPEPLRTVIRPGGAPRAAPRDTAPRPVLPEEKARHPLGLSIAGAASVLVAWLASGVGQLGSIHCSVSFGNSLSNGCSSQSWLLWIPVVGPWFALADSNTTAGARVPVSVAGIAQAVGVALIIIGLVARVAVDDAVTLGPLQLHPRANGLALTF